MQSPKTCKEKKITLHFHTPNASTTCLKQKVGKNRITFNGKIPQRRLLSHVSILVAKVLGSERKTHVTKVRGEEGRGGGQAEGQIMF